MLGFIKKDVQLPKHKKLGPTCVYLLRFLTVYLSFLYYSACTFVFFHGTFYFCALLWAVLDLLREPFGNKNKERFFHECCLSFPGKNISVDENIGPLQKYISQNLDSKRKNVKNSKFSLPKALHGIRLPSFQVFLRSLPRFVRNYYSMVLEVSTFLHICRERNSRNKTY